MQQGPSKASSTPFKRLGRVVYRRRKYVIIAWLVVLLALIPIIENAAKYESLQQGSATGSNLESVKADDLVSTQFGKTVPNSSLLVVISGANVSSPATQTLIRHILASVKTNSSIVGLNQTANVFSPLYAAITSVNKAVYSTLKGANGTSRLLLGVPALYFGAWEKAFGSTYNVTEANAVANRTAATTLNSANSTAYALYSSRVLSSFYSSWVSSWTNPANANVSLLARATESAQTADASYLATHAAKSRAFSQAVLESVTLGDFLSDNQTQASSRLSKFSVGYLANETSLSTKFVNSTYSLGRGYVNSTLDALAGNMVWKPSRYGLDQDLSTLISSFVSPGRDTTIVSFGFNLSSNSNILAVRSIAHSAVTEAGSASGVQSALVTGGDAISYDFGNSTQADLALILPVTIALLIIATGLFFRSVLTPFITLGTIGVALGISQVFIVLVGEFVAKVDFTVPTVLLTILIGVGTDYSVFVIARYREERMNGLSVQESVETSVTWAGESIATSGATVIISFLALTLTTVTFLRTIGFVVGLGVLVALSVALTLVPAIVGVVGGRTFWPNSGERFARYSASVLSKLEKKRGYFSRSGAFAVKRAKILIVLAIIVTVPAVYVYSTTTPTYDFLSAAPTNLESFSASSHLTSAFGGGRLFPTYVVVTFSQPLVVGRSFNSTEMGALEAMSTHISGISDVRNVTGPTRPNGLVVTYSNLALSRAADNRTFSSILRAVGQNNKTALITVNFGIDPYSTAAISDAQSMRQYLHGSFDQVAGVTGDYIGGASGSILDTKNVFDAQFNSVVPLVAVGVALVLLVVLGSLFLPIFAVFSVLMSIVWTLAATRLVFQVYFNYQILFITPFFLFVTLLGLGMDYNVFILTRIREDATKGRPLNNAIVSAIEQTGGIITAAAIILAGSLGALMLSSDLFLKQLGFAFAYSILIDALIVRTYLVPAVMSTVGKWNWYSPIPFLNRSHALFKKGNEKAAQA
ncbi:MAG: MMPL family transporter [Thaumarchaeota archaeon]|nr:MMPL family transporter [Nitrososphaerota archaeon]